MINVGISFDTLGNSFDSGKIILVDLHPFLLARASERSMNAPRNKPSKKHPSYVDTSTARG